MSAINSILNFAKEAASNRISNLTTNTNAIYEDVQYAKEGLSSEELEQSLFAYSKETLLQYDKLYGNKDGQVSLNEYIEAGVALSSKALNISDENLIEMITRQCELTAKNTDINDDGIISVEEESLIDKIADVVDSEDGDTMDGKITASGNETVAAALIDIDTDVTSKYISGEKLTDEEQKKLDKQISDEHTKLKSSSESLGVDLSKNTITVEDVENNDTKETEKVTKDNEETQKTIKVDKWGSKAQDGKKYANDSLSKIIANYYPEIKLYSAEYDALVEKIVSTNNLKDANSLSTGKSLILP